MSLLTACEQPESTTVRAPNDLNGVWRLAQITYILGDTWSIMANEPTQTMRLYDGDSVFYEFKPLEAKDYNTLLTLNQLEMGKSYELIATTLSGLYRYKTDKIFYVVGRHHDTPTIIIDKQN